MSMTAIFCFFIVPSASSSMKLCWSMYSGRIILHIVLEKFYLDLSISTEVKPSKSESKLIVNSLISGM